MNLSKDKRLELIANFVFRDSKLKSVLKVLKTGTIISLLSLVGIIISCFALEFKSQSLQWKYIIFTGAFPAIYLLVQLIRIIFRIIFVHRDWYQDRSIKALWKDIIEILKE